MDIENKKKEFISLLRSAFEAQQIFIDENKEMANTFGLREEEFFIDEKTLVKYGFGEKDFWEIICPSLKKARVLIAFNDPAFQLDHDFQQTPAFKSIDVELTQLSDFLRDCSRRNERYQRIENKMSLLSHELGEQKKFFVETYRHKFVVNRDMLLSVSKAKNQQCWDLDGDDLWLINPDTNEKILVGETNLIGVKILKALAEEFPKFRELPGLYKEFVTRANANTHKQKKKWLSNSINKVYKRTPNLRNSISISFPQQTTKVVLLFKAPKSRKG